jgi:hypothetical protein
MRLSTSTCPPHRMLLSLGPAGRASTSRYDIVSGTLRGTDIGNGDAPNPLVSNLKRQFQYGIDSDGDGALDTWSSATGAWRPANLLLSPRVTLDRIKALASASSPARNGSTPREYAISTGCSSIANLRTRAPVPIASGNDPGNVGGAIAIESWKRSPLRSALWNRAS